MEQFSFATKQKKQKESKWQLVLLTKAEAQERAKEEGAHWQMGLCSAPRGECKSEWHGDRCFGAIWLPQREKTGELEFFFLQEPQQLTLVCEDPLLKETIQRLEKEGREGLSVPEAFLPYLIHDLLQKDGQELMKLEQNLSQMEEEALEGKEGRLNHKMSKVRKHLRRLSKCYMQLDDFCDRMLEEGMAQEAGKKEMRRLQERVNRLRQEAVLLREYAQQVREIEQSQLDRKQNAIMRLLTVVTTICLPLTLITGWYGMNFSAMPELQWKYGYPAVILVSAAMVILCIVLCKKKGFFR